MESIRQAVWLFIMGCGRTNGPRETTFDLVWLGSDIVSISMIRGAPRQQVKRIESNGYWLYHQEKR